MTVEEPRGNPRMRGTARWRPRKSRGISFWARGARNTQSIARLNRVRTMRPAVRESTGSTLSRRAAARGAAPGREHSVTTQIRTQSSTPRLLDREVVVRCLASSALRKHWHATCPEGDSALARTHGGSGNPRGTVPGWPALAGLSSISHCGLDTVTGRCLGSSGSGPAESAAGASHPALPTRCGDTPMASTRV